MKYCTYYCEITQTCSLMCLEYFYIIYSERSPPLMHPQFFRFSAFLSIVYFWKTGWTKFSTRTPQFSKSWKVGIDTINWSSNFEIGSWKLKSQFRSRKLKLKSEVERWLSKLKFECKTWFNTCSGSSKIYHLKLICLKNTLLKLKFSASWNFVCWGPSYLVEILYFGSEADTHSEKSFLPVQALHFLLLDDPFLVLVTYHNTCL